MSVLIKKIYKSVFILKKVFKLKSENNNFSKHKIQDKDEIRYFKYKNITDWKKEL